jgi:ferredoxin
MKVSVDPELCQCTGFCVRIAPAIFSLPPDAQIAHVILDQPGPEYAESAREAEDACPTNAIRVVDV